VGTRHRHHEIIGVDRLRALARADVDRSHPREQTAGIEHALDERQHGAVNRHLLEHRILREQVVGAQRGKSLGRVPARRSAALALDAPDRRDERGDELSGSIAILEDRES
jgi:hypothetical protein